MAFYPPASYKPQIRQEGFHLPSPPPSVPSPPPQSQFDPNNMFMPHFLPDSFRKAHTDSTQPSMDFSEELASLMNSSPQPPHHQHHPHHHQSHERSTQSPDASDRSPHSQTQHPPQQYRHNIFDISAPHSYPQQHQQQPQQFSLPTQLPPLSAPFHDPYNNNSNPTTSSGHAHYNNGLPTISSSLRYDTREAPPSAYHHPVDYSRSESADTRSRSRSRPPTATEPPSTHGGPARTARPKRGSVSSASPPRHGAHPHAILIPPHRQSTSGLPVSPLSMHSASTWHQEFSLPTPDSLGTGAFGSYGTPGAGGISPKDIGDPAQDAAAKQAMIAHEKRRRRRESHNAVERRRRDNINEKISELATLIPECMLDPGVAHPAPAQTPTSPTPDDVLLGNLIPEGTSQVTAAEDSVKGEGPGESVVKANKGMILRKSVEYIRYLQQLVMAQANRNRELEAQIGVLRTSDTSLSPTHHNGTHSSINGTGNVAEELILHDELQHVGSGKWEHALGALAESESDDVDMEAESGSTAERGRQRHRAGALGEDVRVKEEGMEVS